MHKINAVFFDIDGTILLTQGAGRQSFCDGLKQVFDHDDDLADISFAGCTDLGVIREVLEDRDIAYSDDQIFEFFDAIAHSLKRQLANDDTILFPGVAELLERLAELESIRLGLVTGNVETCAYLKIESFGFGKYFPVGAFGGEHHDRNKLAAMARERIEKRLTPSQTLDRCYIIGDTPSDVAAAQANGMTAIAVATGHFDRAALERTGAEFVFDDLSDVGEILEIMV